MASLTEQSKARREQINLGSGGQSCIAMPARTWMIGTPKPGKSRWLARLDILQSASGLLLAALLMTHLLFVASLLISQDAFHAVARIFEGAYHLGKPYPVLVSSVVTVILVIFISHAWLAMRKFPAGYRQHRTATHDDTSLWWLQIWTGFALFFMASIHLYDLLTQPSMISPFAAAERMWTGNMWPLYLMLTFAAELHASIGLYRLAIKWGWFATSRPHLGRRRQHLAKHGISAFFITLGLLTLAAYVELGRNHAAHAGERYVPTYQRTLPTVDID